MTSKAAVEEFLSQKKIAVVGASRKRTKFGGMVYRGLKKKGFNVFPVNPNAGEIDGDKCYPDLAALPEPVGGALIVVKPEKAEAVVREAAEAGIRRIWIQQGAESDAAIRFCEENDIQAVHGECIMMFAQPVGFGHGIHRLIWKLLGKLPK